MNCLSKTVTLQRRGCDLNPGPSAPESSTLTTRLPSHPYPYIHTYIIKVIVPVTHKNRATVQYKGPSVYE